MYGKGKTPIMNLGFIKAETLKKNPDATTMTVDGKKMPIKMYGKKSMAKMYDKKSPAKKYAPGQAAAIYAQKADDAKKKKRK